MTCAGFSSLRVCVRVCVAPWRTHLHGEDSDVVPADLLSVQRTHRHQRPGSDLDVEELPGVTGPLDGIPGDTERRMSISVELSAALCVS